MQSRYTIKEIVEMTGVSAHTLRYYERIGLLDPVGRDDNGHRRYDEADVRRLYFLKRVKATGMSISEMQHYVDLFRQGDDTIVERREILEQHREHLLAQINLLQETIELLDTKISNYHHQEVQLQHDHETEIT